MLQATLLSPSDNKPAVGRSMGFAGHTLKPSDNTTRPGNGSTAAHQHSTPGQQLTGCAHGQPTQPPGHHQATRAHHRPPQASDGQKTQQNQAKNGHVLSADSVYIYCTCISNIIPKYILYYHIIPYDNISYDTISCDIIPSDNIWCDKVLISGFILHACATPPYPKKMDPLFTGGPNHESNCTKK